MDRTYAGFSREKNKYKNFKSSIKLIFLLFSVSASTFISMSTSAAGYDCYMVRPCWWEGDKSWLHCGVVHTYCRYIPDFPPPGPPSTPPPPPYIPPPVSNLKPEEKEAYCNASSYEVAADKQSCDAGVDLVSTTNLNNCGIGEGTLKWDYQFRGVRFSMNVGQTFYYRDNATCRAMNVSFSNYARSQCAAQENRARGAAVSLCGPIQW